MTGGVDATQASWWIRDFLASSCVYSMTEWNRRVVSIMSTNRTAGVMISGVFLALVAFVPVAAQQDDPRVDRIRAGLPTATAQQIELSVAEARANGLPFEALLDKAVEGIAKGVPAPRIAGAVAQLAGELATARSILEDGTPPVPTDVAAVADAMRRGVPEPAIRRVAGQAGPGEPVALAVHTMGDLMDRGVPAQQAVAVLDAWRFRGAHQEELRELADAVERLIRQGVMPGPAAAALANAMRGGPPGAGAGQGPGGGQGPGAMSEGWPPIPPGSGPPSQRGGPPGSGPPGGG
jgi:hypothetical protein